LKNIETYYYNYVNEVNLQQCVLLEIAACLLNKVSIVYNIDAISINTMCGKG